MPALWLFPSRRVVSSHLAVGRRKWTLSRTSKPGQQMMTQSNRYGFLYLDLSIADCHRIVSVFP